jgi:beta-N-acetylhexosaminidase
VQRFKKDGFTVLPMMHNLGQYDGIDSTKALKTAFACGWVMAQELLSCGVDLSFAPVLDLHNPKSQIIGKYHRAISANVSVIARLGKSFIEGVHAAGMKTVAKHYPGHGSVLLDTHHSVVIDDRTKSSIETDMRAFKDLRDQYDAIMLAHVIYSQVDFEPASCSKKWLEILRKETGFTGVTFSDALNMKAAAELGDYPERVQRVIDAGVDIPIICGTHEEIVLVLNQVKINASKNYEALLGKLQGQLFQYNSLSELQKTFEWKESKDLIESMRDCLHENGNDNELVSATT